MDIDGDGSVTKDEAIKFWGKNFAKVNANSMFNEVDEDGNGSVTWDEFTDFWKNVVGSGCARLAVFGESGWCHASSFVRTSIFRFGVHSPTRCRPPGRYSEEDLIEEVEMMLEGGSWVDFNDGRTT